MIKVLNLLVIGCYLLALSSSADPYNRIFNFDVPADLQDIEYSADQKYILLAGNTTLYLHNGVTTEALRTYNLQDGSQFSAMAFSQDSSKFVVAYKLNTGEGQFGIQYTHQCVEQNINKKSVTGVTAGWINSLCFTADNRFIVLGTSNKEILIYNMDDFKTKSVKFDDLSQISSVACSPYGSLEFSVSGNEGAKGMIKQYNIDPVDGSASEVLQKSKTYDDQNINSLTYSSQGNYLYFSGSKGVYKLQVNSRTQTTLYEGDLMNFHRIRVSSNQDAYAASTIDKKLLINKVSSVSYNLRSQQVVDIGISNFGFSPSGANIFFIKSSGSSAQIVSQCKINEYFNVLTSSCVACNGLCGLCYADPLNCYSCVQSYYLSNNICSPCFNQCQACDDGSTCKTCKKGSYLKEDLSSCLLCSDNCLECTGQNACSLCSKGTYLKEDSTSCLKCNQNCLECSGQTSCITCKENLDLQNGLCVSKGLASWVIVLIVLLCVSVAIVIGGVIYLRTRRQKNLTLLTDQDQERALD